MGGGFGRTLIAAAAAAPIVRDYLHGRRRSGDSDDSDGTVIPSRSTQFFDTHLRSSQSPDEMARRPLVGVETHLPGRQPSGGYGAGYGTILGEGSSSLRGSPERMRRDSWLDRVPEEGALDEHDDDLDEDEEWDLAEQGYYSGECPSPGITTNSRRVVHPLHCTEILFCTLWLSVPQVDAFVF